MAYNDRDYNEEDESLESRFESEDLVYLLDKIVPLLNYLQDANQSKSSFLKSSYLMILMSL